MICITIDGDNYRFYIKFNCRNFVEWYHIDVGATQAAITISWGHSFRELVISVQEITKVQSK